MTTPNPKLAGKKVLVVDDEADLRDILTFTLKRENLNVVQASNAEQAIAMIRSERPDIIISDIRMPGGDGYSLLKSLHLAGSSTPIIIITGSESHADSVWSELGVFKVISKPFTSADILEAVRSCFP